MSPEEILQDLRDVETPAPVSDALPAVFSPWPFYVLAAIIAVLVLVWWRRSRRWRRQAAARLAAMPSDPQARWAALVALTRQVARRQFG